MMSAASARMVSGFIVEFYVFVLVGFVCEDETLLSVFFGAFVEFISVFVEVFDGVVECKECVEEFGVFFW